MTTALLLLGYAAIAGTWVAGLLREGRWPAAAPRLAIAAWQALATSVLLAVGAAGLALTVNFSHVGNDLGNLLRLCTDSLQHGYASPGVTQVIGTVLFLAVVARTVGCALRAAYVDLRERHARIAILDVVGSRHVVPGALVIDHEEPSAFCVGGRRHRVVVTSGLLSTLTEEELRAVLAHEMAHLRQRHHVAILLCRTLFGALAPFLPAFRSAMPRVRLYAELSADDCARTRVGARPLRTALTALACGPTPAGTLAASAHAVEARLERLSGSRRRLGVLGSVLAATGIGTAIFVPLTLVAAPLVAIVWEGLCVIG